VRRGLVAQKKECEQYKNEIYELKETINSQNKIIVNLSLSKQGVSFPSDISSC